MNIFLMGLCLSGIVFGFVLNNEITTNTITLMKEFDIEVPAIKFKNKMVTIISSLLCGIPVLGFILLSILLITDMLIISDNTEFKKTYINKIKEGVKK